MGELFSGAMIIIAIVVYYGCERCSSVLREARALRSFKLFCSGGI